MKISSISSKNVNLNALIVILGICAFPMTYLTVRHGVHVSLYLLLILSVFHWLFISKNKFAIFHDKSSLLVVLSLSSLLLATLISQTIRQDLNWKSFDGPSRIFFSGLVFIYLKNIQVSPVKILEKIIPISLIILLVVLTFNPELRIQWGGRLASKFVDPNSLGSQVIILSMICFFTIKKNDSTFSNILKLTGGITGIYICLYAGSRGGWLALPFLALLGLYLKLRNLSINSPNKLMKPSIALLSLLTLIASLLLAYKNSMAISIRIDIAIIEIMGAFLDESYNTSVGTRIAMWKLSLFKLVPMAGFAGFGEGSLGSIVSSLNLDPIKFEEPIFHLSNTGPHSDLLAKSLSMGYLGGVAYLATLLIPWSIFWKNKCNPQSNIRIAAHIGLCFIAGVFICGFSNEMLSLKYLSTFYGLFISCLMAETLRTTPT